MEGIAILVFIVTWIWSIVVGLQVSVLCAVLSFFFPPIAQVIFSIYEESLRGPMIILVICSIIMYQL